LEQIEKKTYRLGELENKAQALENQNKVFQKEIIELRSEKKGCSQKNFMIKIFGLQSDSNFTFASIWLDQIERHKHGARNFANA